jgi:hypothetical protein
MRKRRNNFLQQLEERRSKATPAEKPVSEMSEQELDAEEARLRGELRRTKEQELTEMRQEQASSSGSRFLFTRRKKRPWK